MLAGTCIIFFLRSNISALFKRVMWCTNLVRLAFGESCQTRGRVFWKKAARNTEHVNFMMSIAFLLELKKSPHFYFQNNQTTESKWTGHGFTGSLLLLDYCLFFTAQTFLCDFKTHSYITGFPLRVFRSTTEI